jgi:hypothetical protein
MSSEPIKPTDYEEPLEEVQADLERSFSQTRSPEVPTEPGDPTRPIPTGDVGLDD